MEGAGFFQNLLKRAFTSVTDMIVKPRGFDPSKHTQGWLRRPFDMPPLHDLSQMVASTYKTDPPDIQGYTLLSKTPTVSFFQVNKKKNVIIIALRGTSFSDINDISADLRIVKDIVEDANTARSIRNSRRYIDDVAAIKAFQSDASQYLPRPSAKMVYYAVGHSLSGAIIDELLEDGLVSSAVSFNPAIERINLAKDNNNHRVYLECDVLYSLLGKFITNGNLEVIPKENPFGATAGPIDTSKGSIKCHQIDTVVPLMSGKGDENNFSYNNKGMSFQDLINRSSSFRLDKFKPIGSPCDRILEQPVTQDVGPNSGRERQQRAYRDCLARQKQGASGSGFLDNLAGHFGDVLKDQASKGNIFGRIKNTIDEGARKRKEEQDREWNNSWVSKVIPNPMKLFGGAVERPPRPPSPPPRPVVPVNRGVVARVNAEIRRLTGMLNNHEGRFFLRSILENYYRVVLRNYIRSRTAERSNQLGALLNNMVGLTSALVGGEDRATVRELNSAVGRIVLEANGEDDD
jgi:hypothetical protein